MQQSSASTRPGEAPVPRERRELPPAPEGHEWITWGQFEDRRKTVRGLGIFGAVMQWGVVIAAPFVLVPSILVFLMAGGLVAGDEFVRQMVVQPVVLLLVGLLFSIFLGTTSRREKRQLDQAWFSGDCGLVPLGYARWDLLVAVGWFGLVVGVLPCGLMLAWTALMVVAGDVPGLEPVLLFGVAPLAFLVLMVLFVVWGRRGNSGRGPLTEAELAGIAPRPRTVSAVTGAEAGSSVGLMDGVGD